MRVLHFLKDSVLPRTVFLPFLFARLLLLPAEALRWFRGTRRDKTLTHLCIEAGERGWQLLEFKELFESAIEYLGKSAVSKVEISKKYSYPSQVKRGVGAFNPSHYVYDPRTGSQTWWQGLLEALSIAWILHIRDIIPICIVTDISTRLWRAQVAVVTARRGLVINYISAKAVAPIFPHRRLIGPVLMPLSERTLLELDSLRSKIPQHSPARAIFTGSLYEPRTSTLEQIRVGLEQIGLTLDIQGRTLGSPRVSDAEYWSRLCNASILVTTVEQVAGTPGMDWTWIPSLLYRFIEATAAGALLVVPEVPGMHRYFTPGVHFIPFSTAEHAVQLIAHYLGDEAERKRIARQGYEHACNLVKSRMYWATIDAALGTDGLTG